MSVTCPCRTSTVSALCELKVSRLADQISSTAAHASLRKREGWIRAFDSVHTKARSLYQDASSRTAIWSSHPFSKIATSEPSLHFTAPRTAAGADKVGSCYSRGLIRPSCVIASNLCTTHPLITSTKPSTCCTVFPACKQTRTRSAPTGTVGGTIPRTTKPLP